MGTWTTNVRIGVGEYRTSRAPDELIAAAERRVRRALLGATDPDAEIVMGWQTVIPADGRVRAAGEHRPGDTHQAWTPGEDIPDTATELVCRGRAVT